jgi:hypothetical protein
MTDPPSVPAKLSVRSERESMVEWRPGVQSPWPHMVGAPPSVPPYLFLAILGAIILMTLLAFAACVYVAASRTIPLSLQTQLIDTFTEIGKMGFVGLLGPLGLVGGKAMH